MKGRRYRLQKVNQAIFILDLGIQKQDEDYFKIQKKRVKKKMVLRKKKLSSTNKLSNKDSSERTPKLNQFHNNFMEISNEAS